MKRLIPENLLIAKLVGGSQDNVTRLIPASRQKLYIATPDPCAEPMYGVKSLNHLLHEVYERKEILENGEAIFIFKRVE